MRWNMVFGALVVSVGLCSQSFGFELLERMLGLNDCGCNSCCQPACEPSCGCDKGCEPTCCAQEQSCCAQEQSCCAQEQSCCAAEQSCCAAEPSCGCEQQSCCHRRRHGDLFCGLRGLFDCHKCKKSCCEQTCAAEPTCCAAEQSCCAAEPTCCEQQSCCKPRRRCHRGLLDIFRCHHRHNNCCNSGCGDSCGNGGCSSCGGGEGAPAPAAGDMPGEEAAPMPPAPTPDQSASVKSKRRVVSTASRIARN